jgi:NADP-dependent 3-hydroxy acid dehydrogenase YdfG
MVDPGNADGDLYTLDWELTEPGGSGGSRRPTSIAFFDAMPGSGTAAGDDVDPAQLAQSAAGRALIRIHEHLRDPRSGVLAVATRGAVAVRPGDALALDGLAAAAVLGLVRAAQREQPGRLLLIDADPEVESSDLSDLADAALASGHEQIAVRQGRILVPRLRVRPGTDSAAQGIPHLRAGGTVLITGGTGALGALAARHLAEQAGVTRLLLLSRQGPDAPRAAELLKDLAGAGAEANIVSCDAADADRLRDVLAAVDPEHPLCAVIHTAGVLDDAIFADLTPDRLATTMRGKASAAWNLHELTAHLPLDAFVLYSSVMGVLGNAGQANYCAANTFLDALAQHRRSRALPAVSIAWGFWSRAGAMTGGLSEADRCRLTRLGLVALADDRGMELLGRALAGNADAVLVAAGLDVLTLVEQRAAGLLPPALRGLLPDDDTVHEADASGARANGGGERAAAKSADDDADPFGAMNAGERQAAVEELVRRHVAAALGHPDPWTLPMDRGLADLGLTSMAGLELRTRLAVALGTTLPSTLIFDHPTARAVAQYAYTLLAQDDAEPWQAASRVLDELTGLVAALLSEADGVDGAEGAAADDAGSAVARRLRELAARLDPGSPPGPAAAGGGAADPETDAAQDELQMRISQAGSQELMALLDRELAGARVPDHDVEGG